MPPLYLEKVQVAALAHRRTRVAYPTLAPGGASILVSLETAVIVARPGSLSALPLIALLEVAGITILLSLRPEMLLLFVPGTVVFPKSGIVEVAL
jgi:hypothetical protein